MVVIINHMKCPLSIFFLKPEPRGISVVIMTSSLTSSVHALNQRLEELCSTMIGIVGEVRILELPYSGIDSYRFSNDEHFDVMILCHSIQNRRFAITDVVDSLYDEFLAYCNAIGKNH